MPTGQITIHLNVGDQIAPQPSSMLSKRAARVTFEGFVVKDIKPNEIVLQFVGGRKGASILAHREFCVDMTNAGFPLTFLDLGAKMAAGQSFEVFGKRGDESDNYFCHTYQLLIYYKQSRPPRPTLKCLSPYKDKV